MQQASPAPGCFVAKNATLVSQGVARKSGVGFGAGLQGEGLPEEAASLLRRNE
jgi:hypothetical protein